MISTRKAVRIIWSNASGGGDATLDYDAPHCAEAICRAIDDMEASGIDLMACDSFAIVAKAGAGAEAMLATREPMRVAA